MPITQTAIPDHSFLAAYAQQEGSHIDCFATEIDRPVTLSDLLETFFSTPLFRVERLILRTMTRMPTSDQEVSALANGTSDRFALWRTEARDAQQLLMAVGQGPIRSWWMVSHPMPGQTRLHFGSAVVPTGVDRHGRPVVGGSIRLLKGFHLAYSRLLLRATARRL